MASLSPQASAALCQSVLDDFASRERDSRAGGIVAIGVTLRHPASTIQWSSRQWIEEAAGRDDRLGGLIQAALRRAVIDPYGVVELPLDKPLIREEHKLFFSHLRKDHLAFTGSRVTAWCLSTRMSRSGFTPLQLREFFHLLASELEYESTDQLDPMLASSMVTAGDSGSALEIVRKLTDAAGGILWSYDENTRRFESIESVGIPTPRRYTVDSVVGNSRTRSSGIVGQVRPEEPCVVYDRDDASVWRPAMRPDWRPHDQTLFDQQGWRSCVAWPISMAGRLVGALSVYSTGPPETLFVDDTSRRQFAHVFAASMEIIREQKIARAIDRVL